MAVMGAEGGFGAGLVAGIDFGEGDAAVAVGIVVGHDLGHLCRGDAFHFFEGEALGDFVGGEVAVAVVVEAVVFLLEADEFVLHGEALGIGVGGVVRGSAGGRAGGRAGGGGAGGEEEGEEEEGFHVEDFWR